MVNCWINANYTKSIGYKRVKANSELCVERRACSVLCRVQERYMGMGRKWLIPEMICDPPRSYRRGTELRRKGLINSLTNVLNQQGPANVIINQSNNYCTHQMPGTVAGTRDSEMKLRQKCILALKE